ncbi:histone-lysine N-methyltransferase SETMAR [Trichonephila clavipes]|nr:histone-lysine N-methyltransferase SETMAR [Trichonephila clavipes]
MAGRLDFMKHLGCKLGHFSVTYAFQSDNARIKEAEMKSRSSTLDARRALRMRKKAMHEHFVEAVTSGDLSLCDKARTGRLQALDDEDLEAAIEQDSGQTYVELARPHVAWMAMNTTQRLGWETLYHPLYSPDLAPSYYHLFHSLDNHLRGKSFTNAADVLQALTDF